MSDIYCNGDSTSYKHFASCYDILTANIPYRKRGEYFHSLISRFGKPECLLLDLACGTGSLSEVMAALGYDVIGVDNSFEMLSEASQKKISSGHDIMYLCQDMCELDLYSTVDACICALDSINHIVESDEVQMVFDGVMTYLEPKGLFIFDVNTPYKHEYVLADNTYIYDCDNVYCVWQNSFDDTVPKEKIVDIKLDLFIKAKGNRYERFTEEFSERAYTHDEILSFAKAAGFEILAYYEDGSFDKPSDEAERVVYILQKP